MATGTLRVDRFSQQDPSSPSQPPNSAVLFHPSSLSAPNRSRSITIDDYHNPTQSNTSFLPPVSSSPNHSSSTSDSDDDENDHPPSTLDLCSRSKPHDEAQNRHARKTSSSLSLDSLQNDSDAADSALVDPTSASNHVRPQHSAAPPKRPKLSRDVPQVNHAATLQTHVDNGSTLSFPKGVTLVSRTGGRTNNVCTNCGAPTPVDPKDPRGRCACTLNGGVGVNAKGTAMDATRDADIVPVGEGREGRMGKTGRYLVNIAPLPESDGAGWDRFIFFSYRSQRFHFESETYLSTFSPFAAVASGMEGVTSVSVCAVCGTGGSLTACCRCPLAFHKNCIDPTRRDLQRVQRQRWFCNACKSVKRDDTSCVWEPATPPPPLPSPETGFARLIADARDGNPIDLVFNPTLFNYYWSQCGADWLRCRKCKQIRIAGEGVLTESVRVPFECAYAFWVPEETRKCYPAPLMQAQKSNAVKAVEKYVENRSRRRNALFFYRFGEDDRTAYGFPALNVSSEPAKEVIVIEDEESEAAEVNMGVSANEDQSMERTVSDSRKPALAEGLIQAQQVAGREDIAAKQANHEFSRTANSNQRQEFVTPKQNTAAVASAITSKTKAATPQKNVEPSTSRAGEASTAKNVLQQIPTKSERPRVTHELETKQIVPQKPGPVSDNTFGQVSNSPATTTGIHTDPTVALQTNDVVSAAPSADAKEEPQTETKREDEPLQGSSPPNDDLQRKVLPFIASLELDVDVEDCLTDMALEGSDALNQLYLAFHHNGAKFKRHATRLANRTMGKDTSSIRF